MDSQYFEQALKLAKKAFLNNEVPIGAVVVDESGKVIGRGYNKVHARKDVTYHAEMIALRQAQKKGGDWRLEKAKLYVTLEPCVMCLGMALLTRVKEIHFILNDPTFGSLRSVMKKTSIKGAYKNTRFVQHQDREWEVASLMKEFFKKKRNKKS